MRCLSMVFALLFLLPGSAFSASLPDTGQTKCYNNTQEITCPNPGEDFYGQDAQYGPNLQSFTKLDANGNDLPDDALWPWAMVRDDVTGLIWEVKTDDGSIHDKNNSYDFRHAPLFVSSINNDNFGGYVDWRLPLMKELLTIINRNAYYPSVNTLYFPNTGSGSYWSGNAYPYQLLYPWYPTIFSLIFYDGSTWLLGNPKSGETGQIQVVHGQEISNNFIDNGDGTVTDFDIGLMWQQGTAPGLYTWQQSLAYCENLTLAGYHDWRLPNVNELHSIVHYQYDVYDPAVDTTYFPDSVSGYYWSSTTYANAQQYAWKVGFYDGAVLGAGNYCYSIDIRKSDALYVRAVRDYVDSDHDGIVDDGDRSGMIGDNPCTAGQTEHCDDNCPYIANSIQEDSLPPHGNGIGDACECEADFMCDSDVDGSDAALFKFHFGRKLDKYPCTSLDPCRGDFSCDGDVDGTDAAVFKQDFGRRSSNNSCPVCVAGIEWCGY